ncbi:MAG: DUF3037 domain-containing protein [Actinomycetota bacterium]|nr:DUF3037 domain-containing protein [Actinomycetota bacterium]
MIGYQYVTLRCVPRVEREEFVNVGVVLFAQSAQFLASAHEVDGARLRGLAPGLDLDTVEEMLCTVQAVCRGDEGRGLPHLEGLGRRFGWLAAPRSTIVQPSPRHGGLCRDPATELTRLMTTLVTALP